MSSVDVIVPCYRYGHFLRECVESVLSQKGVQVRVLIIDDASPDDTESIGKTLAAEDSRVIFRRHQRNIGNIATYNEGLEWASADYLLLLSADDYLLPGALERASKFLDSQPAASFVCGQAVDWQHLTPRPVISKAELENKNVLLLSGEDFIYRSRIDNCVYTPTAVVRTVAQKRAGGYDPRLPHNGDMEMWWRLATLGKVGILESKQAVYRRHTSNMSINYFGMPDIEQREAMLEAFERKISCARSPDKSIIQAMRRGTAEYIVNCANNAFIVGDHDMQNKMLKKALKIYPGIICTAPWIKLSGKRLLGRSACAWIFRNIAPKSHSAALLSSRKISP